MKESVMRQLVKCPNCGTRYRPDIEGRPDGTACFKCEDLPDQKDQTDEIEKASEENL